MRRYQNRRRDESHQPRHVGGHGNTRPGAGKQGIRRGVGRKRSFSEQQQQQQQQNRKKVGERGTANLK